MQTERVAPVLLRSAHADIGSESSDWWCEIDAPCRWYHDALMLCQGWHAESNSCHGQYLDRQRLGGSDARSGYHECPFQWQGLLQYRDRQSCSSTSGIRRWGHLGVKQMMRGISSRFRSHSSLPLRSRKVYISSFTMHVWYSDVSVKNWKWLACFWITQLRRSYTSSLKRSAAWTHFSIQVTSSSRKPRISSISGWKVMFCGSKSLIGPKANGKMPVTHTVFPGSDSAATLKEEKKETKCGQWLTADALVPVSPNCSSSACRRGLSQSSTRTMRYSDVFLTLSYSFTALASSTRYSPASPSGAGSVQKSLSSGCNTRKWATVVAIQREKANSIPLRLSSQLISVQAQTTPKKSKRITKPAFRYSSGTVVATWAGAVLRLLYTISAKNRNVDWNQGCLAHLRQVLGIVADNHVFSFKDFRHLRFKGKTRTSLLILWGLINERALRHDWQGNEFCGILFSDLRPAMPKSRGVECWSLISHLKID